MHKCMTQEPCLSSLISIFFVHGLKKSSEVCGLCFIHPNITFAYFWLTFTYIQLRNHTVSLLFFFRFILSHCKTLKCIFLSIFQSWEWLMIFHKWLTMIHNSSQSTMHMMEKKQRYRKWNLGCFRECFPLSISDNSHLLQSIYWKAQ